MINRSRRALVRHLVGMAAWMAAESSHAAEGRVDDLPSQAHELLAPLHAPELTTFLDAWPNTQQRRSVVPSSLPVLRWLPEIQSAAPPYSSGFVTALAAATPFLSWRRSYTAAAVGATFFDNYGWTELVGLTGPLPSEQLACGLLLLGPNVMYPRHRHEAEEIYVPLAGTAAWLGGDEQWRQQAPASVIHHVSQEPHAMRTGQTPLLALYLWRSANLAQKSTLDR